MAEVKNFVNRSIGHTNVKLTWDEPVNRLGFLDQVKPEDMEKVDWKQYFNSGSEDQDDDVSQDEREDGNGQPEGKSRGGMEDDKRRGSKGVQESFKEKEEELRQKGEASDWRKNFEKKKKRGGDELEMEITFEGGFSEVGNKILENVKNKDESSWDRF